MGEYYVGNKMGQQSPMAYPPFAPFRFTAQSITIQQELLLFFILEGRGSYSDARLICMASQPMVKMPFIGQCLQQNLYNKDPCKRTLRKTSKYKHATLLEKDMMVGPHLQSFVIFQPLFERIDSQHIRSTATILVLQYLKHYFSTTWK